MSGPTRFNPYILKTVNLIAKDRAGLGYDIKSYFTRNLAYGPDKEAIPANHPPKTMCVAAVCEVIIEALNMWSRENKDNQGKPDFTPFQQLPARSWKGGSPSCIRAHIFQYSGLKSRGTAHALARFGIGAETSFKQLQPGDFVNFNREKTGHSVVFLSYIDKNYNEVSYGGNVAGFRYFSAQGQAASAPDHGFGYRWGFFGKAPPAPAGKFPDQNIRRSDSLAILDCGYMFAPPSWNVEGALAKLKADFETEISAVHNFGTGNSINSHFAAPHLSATIANSVADMLFEQELAEPDWTRFDDSRG